MQKKLSQFERTEIRPGTYVARGKSIFGPSVRNPSVRSEQPSVRALMALSRISILRPVRIAKFSPLISVALWAQQAIMFCTAAFAAVLAALARSMCRRKAVVA